MAIMYKTGRPNKESIERLLLNEDFVWVEPLSNVCNARHFAEANDVAPTRVGGFWYSSWEADSGVGGTKGSFRRKAPQPILQAAVGFSADLFPQSRRFSSSRLARVQYDHQPAGGLHVFMGQIPIPRHVIAVSRIAMFSDDDEEIEGVFRDFPHTTIVAGEADVEANRGAEGCVIGGCECSP
uniref:Uncharacterized protein n=1 Tax=Moniliophthora roreri TaxID=221103 RepID=A0A0W0ETJ9_MONRR